MRTLLVVVTDVLPEDSPEMALAEHQDMVQTLSPCRSYEALGKSVRPGWLDRAANDTNALRVKHLIESPRVLGVAVPDQELGFGEAIFNREVAGLLGNPDGIWMGGDACQVDPARGDLDKEKHIERLQPHGLHTEEVTGYDASGLLGQELLPRGTISARGEDLCRARGADGAGPTAQRRKQHDHDRHPQSADAEAGGGRSRQATAASELQGRGVGEP